MEDTFCRECVAAQPLLKFLFSATLLTTGALYSLLLTYRCFTKARLIQDMPTSLVRSASQGFTELIGLATLDRGELVAPLTGEPCLWWYYKIERYQRAGKSHTWVMLESAASKQGFFLEDATGRCLVMPEDADLTPAHKHRWRGRHRYPHSAVCNKNAGDTTPLSRMLTMELGRRRRYRYTEHQIKDGDPLYVLGHFESDSSGQRTLSVAKISRNILRDWKRDFAALLAQHDRNNDGQLDLAEWRKVREAAHRAALKLQHHQGKIPTAHQISKPPAGGLPFVISSAEQHQLSRCYRLQALGFAVGFLALGAGATWYISARALLAQ